MKKLIYPFLFLLFIILISLSLFYFFQTDSDKIVDEISLTLTSSHPTESQSFFFQYPNMFAEDEAGNIYVNDQPQSTIFKFDSTGRFIKQIGKEGRGPGEMLNQSYLCYTEGKLFVTDQGNGRILIFGDNGNYLDSFIPNRTPSSIACHDGNMYAYIQYLPNQTIEKDELITTFDSLGNQINKFGKFLNLFENQPALASKPILKIYKERLYVLHHYYPILKVYTLEGRLINSFKLSENRYKDLVPQNFNKRKFSAGSINIKFLFRAMDINSEGIFIGLYNSSLVIDQYGFDGEYIKTYKYERVIDNYYLYDFLVKKSNKKINFITLNRLNNYKISFFNN